MLKSKDVIEEHVLKIGKNMYYEDGMIESGFKITPNIERAFAFYRIENESEYSFAERISNSIRMLNKAGFISMNVVKRTFIREEYRTDMTFGIEANGKIKLREDDTYGENSSN